MRVYKLVQVLVICVGSIAWAQEKDIRTDAEAAESQELQVYHVGPSGLSDADIAYQVTAVAEIAKLHGHALSPEQISFVGDVLIAYHDGEATRRNEKTPNVVWLTPSVTDRLSQTQVLPYVVQFLDPRRPFEQIEHMHFQNYFQLEPELFIQKIKEQGKRFAILDDIADLNMYAISNAGQLSPGGVEPTERAFNYAVHTMLLPPPHSTFFVVDQESVSFSMMHPQFRAVVTKVAKGRFLRTTCERRLN